MKAKKITKDDIYGLGVASLPTRPATPAAVGGKGYTPKELKEAFDRLPLYIIEQFNALIADIEAVGEESLASAIKTGIREGHSLDQLFSDIKDGSLLFYIDAGGRSLATELEDIRSRLCRLEESYEQTEL